MPLPADQVAPLHFPYHPKFGATSIVGCRGGACGFKNGGAGIARAYPRYSNGCERGSCGSGVSCSKDRLANAYFNPSGTAYDALVYGTSTGTCNPSFGCLDPRAQSFDKMAQVHCQDMCIYKQPRICATRASEAAVVDKQAASDALRAGFCGLRHGSNDYDE